MLAKHERDNSSFRLTEKEVVAVVDTNLVSIFGKEGVYLTRWPVKVSTGRS